MLVAKDLHKTYGDKAVVRGVDLTLEPGYVLGLLGPNGAGKSTTVGMLYGMVIPSKGYVRLGEYDLQQQGSLARRWMGVVTQDDNLDPDLNVLDNLICFARHSRLVGSAARHRIAELMEQMNLLGRETAAIEELSGGLKRRLVLARALLNDPKIVFLDEPTTGLDPDARQDFWKLVTQLKQAGRGVLLTTHYMDEAERLCDSLLLMQQGQIVDQGSPQDLIFRTVGQEVIEVEGIAVEQVQALAEVAKTWWRPFSMGYVLVLPHQDPQALVRQVEQAQPSRLLRRRANLEDVFLRLTGERL
ncbi:MAG: ABC transporter ATP-binding protein [Cyanobacteriota bacterium]|nr:ABC transporter ATP-binding protein [Cyanobacteriota bacterium]